MAKERKQFSRDFKIKVVLAYDSGVSAAELARQFEVHPNVIYNWSKEYQRFILKFFLGRSRTPDC